MFHFEYQFHSACCEDLGSEIIVEELAAGLGLGKYGFCRGVLELVTGIFGLFPFIMLYLSIRLGKDGVKELGPL